jgi:SAM-dependent methyltransferase
MGEGPVNFVRRLINFNFYLSNKLDELLPARFRVDGNSDFRNTFVTKYLHAGMTLYDIGGGKRPFISSDIKEKLELSIVGIDISQDELRQAPPGIYDRQLSCDIALFNGAGDGDIAVCQAVLEHVRDNDGAFRGIASCLRSGGVACIFVPSQNALFARLNLMLPQGVKEFLLFHIYPSTRTTQGFPSFYDKCTPADFAKLAGKYDLEVLEVRHYYVSKYFSFFVPMYALWRIWFLLFYSLKGTQAAETFSIALRRR